MSQEHAHPTGGCPGPVGRLTHGHGGISERRDAARGEEREKHSNLEGPEHNTKAMERCVG